MPGRNVGLGKTEAGANTMGIAIGECDRHLNMGAATCQDVKHIGRWIHPDVLADMAHCRAMGLVCPDGFQTGMRLRAFEIEDP